MEAGDPMRRLQLLNTKPDPGTMAGGDTEAGSVPGSVGGWSTVYCIPAQYHSTTTLTAKKAAICS